VIPVLKLTLGNHLDRMMFRPCRQHKIIIPHYIHRWSAWPRAWIPQWHRAASRYPEDGGNSFSRWTHRDNVHWATVWPHENRITFHVSETV